MFRPWRRLALALTASLLAIFQAATLLAATTAPGGEAAELGEVLPMWSALPFVATLLAIALGPLLAPRFWHHHYPKLTLAIALSFAIPFLAAYRGAAWTEILHTYLLDYLPFIILLWGLFTVAGGVVLRGTFAGTPPVNTALILTGTLLASWMGTTGASMLLIRPTLRANARRKHKVHVVVFFIFLVSNIGGSLTPLGDPPLFLGFLRGVPFFWTLRLLPITAFVAGTVLALFYVIDRHYYRREARDAAAARAAQAAESAAALAAGVPPAPEQVEDTPRERLRLDGAHNFLFLAGIVGAVLLSGLWHGPTLALGSLHLKAQNLSRDALIVVMGLLSLATTRRVLRQANGFTWAPIREVAILFAGIFMTIIPALAILKAGERGPLAFVISSLNQPADFFWITGALSSFLDNAPTYLTFFNAELGRFYAGVPELTAVHRLTVEHVRYLAAISAGAVFMGANTYIGNAPNFMVKSIADEAGVAMPSFFGYLLRWAVPVLIPVFLVTAWIFF